MQTSKLTKNVLTYLSLLAVLGAVVIGIFMGKGLYPPSLVSGTGATADLPARSGELQPFIVPKETGTCIASQIYLTLPPKCMTMDGRLIEVPGTSNIVIIPPAK